MCSISLHTCYRPTLECDLMMNPIIIHRGWVVYMRRIASILCTDRVPCCSIIQFKRYMIRHTLPACIQRTAVFIIEIRCAGNAVHGRIQSPVGINNLGSRTCCSRLLFGIIPHKCIPLPCRTSILISTGLSYGKIIRIEPVKRAGSSAPSFTPFFHYCP